MSFSEITIIGFLGADPEVKYTKTNTAVMTISVGVSERLKATAPKDIKPKTYWHKCRRWGKQAENNQTMLKKGDKVFIKGHLIYDTWEDRANRKHKDAVIEIDYLEKMVFENITINLGDD
jgi:single-strand DNA-binding protein